MRLAHLLLTTPLAVLVAAAPALASPRLDVVLPADGPAYGARLAVKGTLRDGGKPLAGKRVELDARPYPFHGDLKAVDHARTDAAGRFTLHLRPARNVDVQVNAPALFTGSPVGRIYVYPRHHLAFAAAGPGKVRVTETYRVASGVRLRRPTVFYLGKRGAARSALRRSVPTRRTGSGRYAASAVVTLPAGWRGRFRYGACFTATPGSGLGDPHLRCPARLRF